MSQIYEKNHNGMGQIKILDTDLKSPKSPLPTQTPPSTSQIPPSFHKLSQPIGQLGIEVGFHLGLLLP